MISADGASILILLFGVATLAYGFASLFLIALPWRRPTRGLCAVATGSGVRSSLFGP
jgi:hypothetical protein